MKQEELDQREFDLTALTRYSDTTSWLSPIPVKSTFIETEFGCRLCIGNRGLREIEAKITNENRGRLTIDDMPTTQEEFELHMALVHGIRVK